MNKHTPGPWSLCRNGDCRCKQIWSRDYPIAYATCGEWGDSYPAMRAVGGGSPSGPGATVEAYMEFAAYGRVAEDVCSANARLICAAPEMYAALSKLRRSDLPESEQPLWDEIQVALDRANGKINLSADAQKEQPNAT